MKNTYTCIFVIVIALLLASCAPKGFIKSSSNNLIHKNSGICFPESIGKLKRLKTTHYAENNVSVGYQITDYNCFTTITAYIYKLRNMDIGKEFSNAKKAIATYHEEELIEEKDIKIARLQDSVAGKYASYTLISHPQGEVFFQTSYLYIFKYKNWFIKYRITHPNNTNNCSNDIIDEFLTNFTWSAK